MNMNSLELNTLIFPSENNSLKKDCYIYSVKDYVLYNNNPYIYNYINLYNTIIVIYI